MPYVAYYFRTIMKIHHYFLTFGVFAASILIAASLFTGCSSSTTPGTTGNYNDSDIVGYLFKPSATVYGKTMKEWSVSWWQWACGTPATSSSGEIFNPLLDTIGTQANLGTYSGTNVFFIGGKFTNVASSGVTRTVTIPHTSLIFFPIGAK